MRDHQARRWGAIPKIASPLKSKLHKKRGGNREGNGTFMSNIDKSLRMRANPLRGQLYHTDEVDVQCCPKGCTQCRDSK